jgi:hypothetical protein
MPWQVGAETERCQFFSTVLSLSFTYVAHGARVAPPAHAFIAHAFQWLALAVLAHVGIAGVGLLMAWAARHYLVLSGHC